MSIIRRRSLLYASNTIEVSQIITIKESGTYTVPNDTIRIDVFMVGAGGGGGLPVAPTGGYTGGYTAGHKGKGGSAVYYENIPFTKGEEISVTIGLAGKGATTANTAGTDGGDTSLGDYTAAGGKGGAAGTNTSTSAGNDGSMICPFGAIDSESITDTALFGADGGDGSTTTTALAGGATGGGKGANRSTAASSATFYGAGGGGGTIYKSWGSATVRNAGDGYDGIVLLKVTRKETVKPASKTWILLPFNKNIKDSSDNGRETSLFGSPTYATGAFYSTNRSDSSIQVKWNSGVVVADKQSFIDLLNSGNFTIELFFRMYISDVLQDKYYQFIGIDDGTVNGFFFRIDGTTGSLVFGVYNDPKIAKVPLTASLRDNEFHHFFVQCINGKYSFGQDGAITSVSTTPNLTFPNADLIIGGRRSNTSGLEDYWWQIDGFRISRVGRYVGSSYTVPTKEFTE